MRRALEQAHSCALSGRQILPGQCLHDEVREGEYVVWIYAEPIGIDDAHDAHIWRRRQPGFGGHTSASCRGRRIEGSRERPY